jgi:hypothetical protein
VDEYVATQRRESLHVAVWLKKGRESILESGFAGAFHALFVPEVCVGSLPFLFGTGKLDCDFLGEYYRRNIENDSMDIKKAENNEPRPFHRFPADPAVPGPVVLRESIESSISKQHLH